MSATVLQARPPVAAGRFRREAGAGDRAGGFCGARGAGDRGGLERGLGRGRGSGAALPRHPRGGVARAAAACRCAGGPCFGSAGAGRRSGAAAGRARLRRPAARAWVLGAAACAFEPSGRGGPDFLPGGAAAGGGRGGGAFGGGRPAGPARASPRPCPTSRRPRCSRQVLEIERGRGLEEVLGGGRAGGAQSWRRRSGPSAAGSIAETWTLWRPGGGQDQEAPRDSAVSGLAGFVARTGHSAWRSPGSARIRATTPKPTAARPLAPRAVPGGRPAGRAGRPRAAGRRSGADPRPRRRAGALRPPERASARGAGPRSRTDPAAPPPLLRAGPAGTRRPSCSGARRSSTARSRARPPGAVADRAGLDRRWPTG